VPHYRIDFLDNVDLSNIGIGCPTISGTFGAFDGRTHQEITAITDASIQREESILVDENWSTSFMTFEEVQNALGQIRGLSKKSQ
jgi:hypothetical protein